MFDSQLFTLNYAYANSLGSGCLIKRFDSPMIHIESKSALRISFAAELGKSFAQHHSVIDHVKNHGRSKPSGLLKQDRVGQP